MTDLHYYLICIYYFIFIKHANLKYLTTNEKDVKFSRENDILQRKKECEAVIF